MNPILRWVGGKKWLSPAINQIIYKNLHGKYHEPFFGSGAIFFGLTQPVQSAILCDIIAPLMNTYREIKENPIEVAHEINKFRHLEMSQNIYEDIRNRFNERLTSTHNTFSYIDASLFIILNRSGFNALWRQNKDGLFNVPYGQKSRSFKLPTTADIIQISEKLRTATLNTINEPYDIFNYIDSAQPGDVIFADPPYYNVYDQYDGLTCHMDNTEFHIELSNHLHNIHRHDVTIITTNIDCEFVRNLYIPFCHIEQIVRWQNMAAQTTDRKQWKQIVMTAIP